MADKKKMRLDVLLTEQGYFPSRAQAQAAVMAAQVLVNEEKIDKPGTQVKPDVKIRILGNKLPYVSRGGLKLEKALQVFPISVEGKVMADIGASTGGFTDCALQNGALRVYAVDVGYGQLDWKLRNDPRVINMERTNARNMTEESLPEQIQGASIDVAFISLTKILPAVKKLLAKDAFVIALVKPQFEAGREHIGKKGVVRDPAVHKDVLEKTVKFAEELGFTIGGLEFSPVKGPEGNIEYLLYLMNECEDEPVGNEDAAKSDLCGNAEAETAAEDALGVEDASYKQKFSYEKRIKEIVKESHSTLDK